MMKLNAEERCKKFEEYVKDTTFFHAHDFFYYVIRAEKEWLIGYALQVRGNFFGTRVGLTADNLSPEEINKSLKLLKKNSASTYSMLAAAINYPGVKFNTGEELKVEIGANWNTKDFLSLMNKEKEILFEENIFSTEEEVLEFFSKVAQE